MATRRCPARLLQLLFLQWEGNSQPKRPFVSYSYVGRPGREQLVIDCGTEHLEAVVRRAPARGIRWGAVRRMILIWGLLGILVGAATSPGRGEPIGVISGIIAGVLVLPWLGAVVGLFGGDARTTAGAAFCGALVAPLVTSLGGTSDLLHSASFGVVAGGLVGGTALPFLRAARAVLALVGL